MARRNTMARPLIAVIDAIMTQIPESEKDLRTALEDQKNSVSYAAPKMIPSWWGMVGETLYMHSLNPATTLERKESWIPVVRQIFMDELNYKDYLPEKTDGTEEAENT
jgi:hypothetical protein